jgi:hypothetical protein
VFSVRADQRLYNEDCRPARIRTESVSGDGSRMIEKRCHKSVARIRLVKTENTTVCVTVLYKVWKSATAL